MRKVNNQDNYSYSFDKRGNLVEGIYHKNLNNPSQDQIMEQYVYDATNRMVKGSKYLGTSIDFEEVNYIYNGLGYLVSNEWIVAKNSQNYYINGISPAPTEQVEGVVVYSRHPESTASSQIDPNVNGYTTGGTTGGVKPNLPNQAAVAHKDFVLDYTSPLQNVILETEKGDGGLTYRYTYGLHKENVVVYGIENGQGSLLEAQHYLTGDRNIVKLYYHRDHLGSTDYLTANKDNKLGEVVSYADYDDWGQLIGNSIVEMGIHKLDLVEEYTGYTYDRVLDLYYAKARMYNASDRRFMVVDWAKSNTAYPQSFNQYAYAINNPFKYIDQLGLYPVLIPDASISIGKNTIDEVFVEDGKVYVDFFNVAKAWEVATPPGRYPDTYSIFSSNQDSYAMVRFIREANTSQRYVTSQIYNTDGSAIPNTYSYANAFGNLVPFEYFAKLMCDLGREKNYSIKLVTMADLTALRWSKLTEDKILDLNRVQLKYEIYTVERVRHFLAQCMKETNRGALLREGEGVKWTSQQSYENYYNTNTKYKYKYRGSGYMHLTWDYSYQAFATFIIQQAYPDLNLKWKSPKNTSSAEIQQLYNTAVQEAKNKGYNIQKYTKIVSEGADYVADNFAWESAGYYWHAMGLNALVDGLRPGNKNDVDKITAVVNNGASAADYNARRGFYVETTHVIK